MANPCGGRAELCTWIRFATQEGRKTSAEMFPLQDYCVATVLVIHGVYR